MAWKHRLDGRNVDLEMSNLLNFILPSYIKKLKYRNNKINHENLRLGVQIFFFFKLIIPEIQHIIGEHRPKHNLFNTVKC